MKKQKLLTFLVDDFGAFKDETLMISNKFFNLAVISILLNVSFLLGSSVNNDSLLFCGAFWVTLALSAVFCALSVAFKIVEYIRSKEKGSVLRLFWAAFSIAGTLSLHVFGAGNLFGAFTWSMIIPNAVFAVGIILIAVSAVLWLISLFGKKRSENALKISYGNRLTIAMTSVVVAFEAFMSYVFVGVDTAWVITPLVIFCCICIFIAVVLAFGTVAIAFKRTNESSAMRSASKILTALGALSVVFNVLYFMGVLFLSFNYEVLSAVCIVSIVLFAAALILKVIDMLKISTLKTWSCKFKAKTINKTPWVLLAVGVFFQILVVLTMFFDDMLRIGKLGLQPLAAEIAFFSIVAVLVFAFIDCFKNGKRSALNITLLSGLSVLAILARELWVNTSWQFGVSTLFHWIFGSEKGWDIGVFVYCVFLALTALILIIAFVGKLVSAIREKAEAGKKQKAFSITGYSIFAAVVILFSIAATNAMFIDFDWNFVEVACILGLFAPIFIALVLALLMLQKRDKTE